MLFKIRHASGERKYLITARNLTELTLSLNTISKNVLMKCSFIRSIQFYSIVCLDFSPGVGAFLTLLIDLSFPTLGNLNICQKETLKQMMSSAVWIKRQPVSLVKKASRQGVWGRSRNPLLTPPPLTPPHSLTPLISEDFLPSRSIWRKLWICRDLFYSSYDISWLGICTSCRKKLAMLMKGVTANKTDEDEPKDEPEVRRSSRLAEKSPECFLRP